MVQLVVHICPLDSSSGPRFVFLEADYDTFIQDIKLQIQNELEDYKIAGRHELVFLGERCEDHLQLKDYGINMPWIQHVIGFSLNVGDYGGKYIDGKLVPYDTPEPDYEIN
mmetsp:Transcript_7770/g.10505  ORF Transcript_7770/g.10505 Transcript_7770/m.10505 type:complete len:111 (-) Transcript_7770:101-433(-)|eukprot:CAMPEP_0196576046 /NCGR_PEP_ID=MMETSP1081-20130531/5407_1 /TAXON_ID=36882 /ORGANISM="Pyramimonas amylifera, Strain CCMP720" /LENGTH=110 /DNA_ID=CAMNT_0041894543 /DNA_START=111 /DNA_END=443 /DNA_ORIENTATION=+